MSSVAVACFYHFLVHVAIMQLPVIVIKIFNRSAALVFMHSLCCDRGVINAAAGIETAISSAQSTCPLVHCHTAVGHSKAILSVFATDTCLYTASKGICFLSTIHFSYQLHCICNVLLRLY